MKFKETIKILTDRGTFKEIKGTVLPYKDGIIDIEVMVHNSDNAWTPDAIEVSEKSTGCRMFSITDKPLKDITPKVVTERVTTYIQGKGKKVFLNQIQKVLKTLDK